jgi:uncharacterized SAM-binding protein YcdF (DUF218 family)
VLNKIIALLISPLGTGMLLLVLALGLAWWRGSVGAWRRRGMQACWVLCLGWLWLWATPATSQWLTTALQDEYPAQAVQALPAAQAVVLLGGGMVGPDARRPYPDLGRAADRVWHAARLYHAGKAPLLVATGGGDPAVSPMSEASAMKLLLLDLGVPESALVLEEASFNTRENALNTAALLKARGVQRVLLVTSALHMRRAVRHFEAAGLQVVPAACDHAPAPSDGWQRWIPSADALSNSAEAIKALAGRWGG